MGTYCDNDECTSNLLGQCNNAWRIGCIRRPACIFLDFDDTIFLWDKAYQEQRYDKDWFVFNVKNNSRFYFEHGAFNKALWDEIEEQYPIHNIVLLTQCTRNDASTAELKQKMNYFIKNTGEFPIEARIVSKKNEKARYIEDFLISRKTPFHQAIWIDNYFVSSKHLIEHGINIINIPKENAS